MAGRKSRASVFELANRIAINNDINDTTGVADSLADHQSGSNNDAHQINNISGLQRLLDSKTDKSLVTQVITVITKVNFANKTVTTANINIVDGIITGIN